MKLYDHTRLRNGFAIGLFKGMWLLIAAVSFSRVDVAQSPSTNVVDSEKYRVYEAVIAHMFSGGKLTFDTQAKVKQLVIRDHTNTDYAFFEKQENWGQVKIRLRTVSDETITDYEANRKPSMLLGRSLNIPLPYTLLPQKEYESIFGTAKYHDTTEDWAKFYDRFRDSGGYIWLSNIGFNKARSQALVYFVHWCGTLCGTGHYILLSKTGKEWKVEMAEGIWIS